MKRRLKTVASNFNSSSMQDLRVYSGDTNFDGVVALVNELLTPYGISEQFSLISIPKYVGGEEHCIKLTFGRHGDTPLIIDVHAPIIECYDHTGRRPLRVVCKMMIGDEAKDEIAEITISPMTMASGTDVKRKRLVRQKSFTERLIGIILSNGKETCEDGAYVPWEVAKPHLSLMRSWVAGKGVGGTQDVPDKVATIVAAYLCAGLRATDTTWQIERIDRYGKGNPNIPSGWLSAHHACVGIYVGVRDNEPLPTFDLVILDECMSHLREDELINVRVSVQTTTDGLLLLAAIL